MFKKLAILLLVLFTLQLPPAAFAQTKALECPHRYLTIINPVRSRQLWKDNNLLHIKNQYGPIKQNGFPATWLIQNDVLEDRELLDYLQNMDSSQEIGVFLEVSKSLAEKSQVIYPHDKPWYHPGTVFLSGYSRSERIRLIDNLFISFKTEFGFYPKAVGAWWIDSYSLNYLKEKYGITSALIVADQKTTDHYGVWGQWWSVPYYPTKTNILTPASNPGNKQDVVILQWAQRHPDLAYGEGYKSSYSLQANDYKLLEKDTNFFKDLVNVYLNCNNPVGQITIGIETGMESIGFIDEYKKQLDYLKNLNGLKALTMSGFASEFKKVYPLFPEKSVIGADGSIWFMDTNKRENKKFNETVIYSPNFVFPDYFIADKTGFLDRDLTKVKPSQNYNDNHVLLLTLSLLISYLIFLKKRKLNVWLAATIFLISSFALLLKSYPQYGYNIYFGPALENLLLVKLLVIFSVYSLFYLACLKLKSSRILILFLASLSFGLDFILYYLRISWISEKFYIGFAPNPIYFTGITYQPPLTFGFLNSDLPSYIAAGLLKIPFQKLWANPFFFFAVIPIMHFLAGVVIYYLIKFMLSKVRYVLLLLLALLLILYINTIASAGPLSISLI